MCLAHEGHMCKSIHHMGSDRASCRMRIALGENHRGSGVTLRVRATWGAVNDSVCNNSSTPVDNFGQRPFLVASGAVYEIIHRWKSVVSKGFVPAFSFAKRGPSKQGGFAALFGWTRIKERPTVIWRVHRRLNAPRPLGKGVMLSPAGWANSCGVTCPDLLASM